jgi:hypothetical protein
MGFLGLAYVGSSNPVRMGILTLAGLVLGGFTLSVRGLERQAAKA